LAEASTHLLASNILIGPGLTWSKAFRSQHRPEICVNSAPIKPKLLLLLTKLQIRMIGNWLCC